MSLYKCETCNKEFSCRQSLSIHRINQHNLYINEKNMNKSGGLTTNNVGKLPSKSSTSIKEDDTKSNNSKDSRDSRYLGRELDKAERFRQMVSSHSSIQLTKSAMKVPAVSPVETSLQFFFTVLKDKQR